MILDAPAKINLSLRVLAQETSGFHQIETLFCALELADEVQVERRTDGVHVTVRAGDPALADVVTQLNAAPGDNIVFKAATAFFAATKLDGAADIVVTKRIPSGAGLGGGSSDAAATLSLLNELYARPLTQDELIAIAAPIGSDVPFFLCGSTLALAWGRGTRLMPLLPLEQKAVVLVAPGESVSTAQAYADLAASRTRDYAARAAALRFNITANAERESRWSDVASNAVNDFEPVIFSHIPELSRIRADLERHGALLAMMTGTGSVVYGVFDDDVRAEQAAAALNQDFRNVRTIVTRTAERYVSLSAPPPSLT